MMLLTMGLNGSALGSEDGFSLVEYQKVIARQADIEGKNVKVWTIKQNGTIRVNLVEMRGELSLHKHPDTEHSLMVIEGRIRVKVGDTLREITKGDFISIPANVPHKYWSLTEKSILVSMDAPYYDPKKTVTLE